MHEVILQMLLLKKHYGKNSQKFSLRISTRNIYLPPSSNIFQIIFVPMVP